jgi:uncharacterized RmlC-like cupin family protein
MVSTFQKVSTKLDQGQLARFGISTMMPHSYVKKSRNCDSECVQVRTETTDAEAVKALRKLIYACDEAIKRGFCLLLSGD